MVHLAARRATPLGWAAAFVCLTTLAACQAAQPAIDEARARAHIETLAGTIGSRPVGTPAHTLAREYVVRQLTEAGMRVRLQQVDATDPARGLTVPVTNVIAWRDGVRTDAIALVSHYDSVPDGPGALDDALGVAICLEAGRALLSAGLEHSLVIVVTDAEELGLMGARAAARDPEIASRVRAFLNFDGTGAAGPGFLFEAGPGWGAPLSAWGSDAVRPAGASFAGEIYKRLPNDTDFTIFKTIASGLNFAPVRDSYAYHTSRDVPDRVEPFTVRHELTNAIAIVRALDRTAPFQRDVAPTFFDIAGVRAVVYTPAAAALIAWGACAAGVLGWIRLGALLRVERGGVGLLLTIGWGLAGLVTVASAAILAAWALRAVRGELNPWYASPIVFLVWLTAAGALAAVALHRLATAVPERWRPRRGPAAVWWATLLGWIALTVAAQLTTPTASYLTALPLAVAGLGALTVARRAASLRVVSLLALVVAAALWSQTALLFEFLASLFGRLPIVMPAWLLPAVLLLAGLMIAPPALAVVAGWRTGAARLVLPGAVMAAIAAGAIAVRSPAFTDERPHLRSARYVHDAVKGEAWWEVGGMEPGLGLNGPTPRTSSWAPVEAAPSTSARVGTIGAAFVHRMPVAPVGDVPTRTAIARTVNQDGTVAITVTVMSPAAALIRLVLPRGIAPVSAAPAGVLSAGHYAISCLAPASASVTLRLSVRAAEEPALSDAVLVTSVAGLPGGQGRRNLPEWLPQDAVTWRARSVYLARLSWSR